MIKNKVVDIKFIFKTYFKILKISSKHFKFSNRLVLQNIIKQFSKTIFKNYFSKLFSKNSYQKMP